MRKNIFISILAVIFLLTCCKKIDSIADRQQPDPGEPPLITPIGTPVGSPVSKTIGSAGGSLISPDGKIELNFPAGALTGNIAISIQPVTNFCPEGIGLAYHLMPNNITFSKPVTLTFHYTDEDVDGSHPYLLYIAYQDSLQTWKADYKNRNIDTIAKTASLDITHFSLWSVGSKLRLKLIPSDKELYENEKREILVLSVSKTKDECDNINDCLSSLPYVRQLSGKNVMNWGLNGKKPGVIPDDGDLSDTANGKATYTAPSTIKNQRSVQVSVEIVSLVVFNKGKRLPNAKFILFKNITLLPSTFDFIVDIHYIDHEIIAGQSGQDYEDKASFELSVKKTEDNRGHPVVRVLASNFKNYAPSVRPVTKTYPGPSMSTTIEWIPDDIGLMNITDVTNAKFNDATNTLSLDFVHTGTMLPGLNLSTNPGGPRPPVPPKPYGGSKGDPQSMHFKLISQAQSFKWIRVSPK